MGERLDFNKEMKRRAHKRAKGFAPKKAKDVHHIVAKSAAKHFRLPTHLVKKNLNAIALERDFHSWIHGNRLTKKQFNELVKTDCKQEVTQLERQIDEFEIEYKGFNMNDYATLAVGMLGIDEDYFT